MLTPNQQIVSDLAAAMGPPPSEVSDDYVQTVVRAAAHLGISVRDDEPLEPVPMAKGAGMESLWGSVSSPVLVGKSSSDANLAMRARNQVFDVVDKVARSVSSAQAAGFSPENNPFVQIAILSQEGRDPTTEEADQIVSDLKVAASLASVDLPDDVREAQLSSATLAMDGFGTKDTVTSLMRLTTDGGEVASSKSDGILAALDFSRRVPHVLFTLEYAPDGVPGGCLVGWKRIADASGYSVNRHDVFANSDKKFSFTNEQLNDSFRQYGEYVSKWIMSFYTGFDVSSVVFFLDSSVQPDEEYVYRVTAYQERLELSGFIFSGDSFPTNFNPTSRATLSVVGRNFPYAAISKMFYGTEKYDWVIAGTNFREAVNRGDDQDTLKSYSYVGADIDFLLKKMNDGRFLVPTDPQALSDRIVQGIIRYGVMQTVAEIFDETGILLSLEGKAPRSPSDPTGLASDMVDDSPVLTTVALAIDPDSATIDTNYLLSSVKGIASVAGRLQSNTVAEIQMADADSPEQSVGGEFVGDFSVRPGTADLTTFDGISDLLRAVGTVSANQRAAQQPRPAVTIGQIASTLASGSLNPIRTLAGKLVDG